MSTSAGPLRADARRPGNRRYHLMRPRSGPSTLRCMIVSVLIVTVLLGWNGAASAQELTARRVLTLGVVSGDPVQEFHMIADVDLIGDSIVAVASTHSLDLRLFDHQGRFLRSWGRKGDGPGEFRVISTVGGVHIARDSIWVVDPYLSRVSVFSVEGTLGRTIDLASFGLGRVVVDAVLPDGNLLLRRSASNMRNVKGWQNAEVEFVRTVGSSTVSLGTFYWATEYVAQQPTGNPTSQAWSSIRLPGGVQAVVAPTHDGFWYADGRQPHIEWRRISDGALVRTVEIVLPRGRIDPDSLRIAQRTWLARQDPGWRSRIEAAVEKMEAPPSLPRGAFELFVDESGSVWYSGHDLHPVTSRVWYRLGADGVTNRVRLPMSFRVRSVRHGVIGGTEQDAWGVEYVALYRVDPAH